MRFGPVLQEFIIRRQGQDGPHFQRIRGFIAEGNSAIRRHAPAVFDPDRAGQPAAIWGHHSPRTEKQGNSYNGSSDRIGPAVGPGVDRHHGHDFGSNAAREYCLCTATAAAQGGSKSGSKSAAGTTGTAFAAGAAATAGR
jgi:hypothetical protein